MQSVRHVVVAAVLAAFSLVSTLDVSAQSHFSSCAAHTGRSAVAIITKDVIPIVDGSALGSGSEVAVFEESGACVGVVVWEGTNAALTIWEDDEMTSAKDGASPGGDLYFAVWDAEGEQEFSESDGTLTADLAADEPYFRAERTYEHGAIYRLAALSVETDEPAARLEAPRLRVPAHGAVDVATRPTLTWKTVAGASAYALQVATDPLFENLVVRRGNVVETWARTAQLDTAATYYWRVRAKSDAGPGKWSKRRRFQTWSAMSCVMPMRPAHRAAALPTAVTMMWEGPDEDVSFELEVATNPEFSPVLRHYAPDEPTRTVSDLDTGETYFWRVRSIYPSGELGHWSETREFSVAAVPTGTEAGPEIPAIARLLSAYPNPAREVVRIPFELPRAEYVTLTVYDVLGRRVTSLASRDASAGRHEVSWNVSSVSTGMYVCRFTAGEKTLSRLIHVAR